MGSHRLTDNPAPAPAPVTQPECTWPTGRHMLAWTGEVATAPDGQLVGRWACQGANCEHAEPRVIPTDGETTRWPPSAARYFPQMPTLRE